MACPTAPLITVVIPAYNAAAYIRESIESVLAQTYPFVEVIVVDDGSTDDTPAIAASYAPRVCCVSQTNSGGVSRPRNHGLSLARGELVAFLDADDVMAPGRLAECVRVLQMHPKAALVFTNFRHFDSAGPDAIDHFRTCDRLLAHWGAVGGGSAEIVLPPDVSTDILATENFGSSAPVLRTAALREVGGYDETLRSVEDYECHFRVASRHPIAVVSQVLLFKRRHTQNMSGDVANMATHQIRVRRALLSAATDARHRRRHRGMLATYHLGLAYYYTGRNNLQAIRYALAAVAYTRRPSVRHFARIAADLLGRDTNGLRRRRL